MEPIQTDRQELSDREREILRLVATGASNKEIAQSLYISANTVKVHLRNIFGKIDASSRTEAAMYAVKMGLVSGAPQVIPESIENEAQQAKGIWPTSRLSWMIWIGAGMLLLLAAVLVGLAINPGSPASPATSAEFSPSGNAPRWQPRAPLPTARFGLALAAYENSLYAIGGMAEGGLTGVVERYDPLSDAWGAVASKPTPVYEIGAVVIAGRVFVPGGRLSSGEVTPVLEIYDPRQDAWTQGKPLPVALSAYAPVAFEGRLYLFGGWDGEKYLDSVYIYDPQQDAWSAGPAMPTRRGYLGAAVTGRKIFVLGGYDGQRALSVNEVFLPDLESGGGSSWQAGKPLPEGKYAMGVTGVADLIYVIGGKGVASSRYPMLVYLDQAQEWQSVDMQPGLSVSYPGVTNLGVSLYLAGGAEGKGETPLPNTLAYQAIYTISFPIIIK